MEISLYGGTGFVGKAFHDRYCDFDFIKLVPRYSRRPDDGSDILYFISTVHNYNVFTDATFDVKTNLNVLTETLESWRNHNPNGIFNFISSWFVYGDVPMPVNEDSPCNPKGFYSITKRCAEQLLISYADTFNMKYRILRLGNVLGKDDTKVSAQKNALQYLINKMKNNEDIDVYEGGIFYRNYIHVNDCVDAIHKVIRVGQRNNIYNIALDQAFLFRNILTYAARTMGYTGKFNYIEQKEFHKKVQAKSFIMDTSKLYSLGFEHRYDMEQMINELL